MDFLRANSRRVQGLPVPEETFISAEDKHVVVIGGGDTGSDCVGTANRHGARSVTQIEILPRPPEREDTQLSWPRWPDRLRTSSSQEEGCTRLWSVATREFIGDEAGKVKALRCVRLDWQRDAEGRWCMSEIEGSEFTLSADLVMLAMGFVHPVHEGLLEDLAIALDARGNVQSPAEGTGAYHTSIPGVFVAGDARRGQSLVVWAIREGRQCARAVDEWLMGRSDLAP
jgi:glutamate synthase (NADPH/NADH) small chain